MKILRDLCNTATRNKTLIPYFCLSLFLLTSCEPKNPRRLEVSIKEGYNSHSYNTYKISEPQLRLLYDAGFSTYDSLIIGRIEALYNAERHTRGFMAAKKDGVGYLFLYRMVDVYRRHSQSDASLRSKFGDSLQVTALENAFDLGILERAHAQCLRGKGNLLSSHMSHRVPMQIWVPIPMSDSGLAAIGSIFLQMEDYGAAEFSEHPGFESLDTLTALAVKLLRSNFGRVDSVLVD